MPKLPGSMYVRHGKRGAIYYAHMRLAGDHARVRLGNDLETARGEYRRLMNVGRVASRITVGELVKLWLAEHVAGERNAKGQKLADSRARRYLLPALEYKIASRVGQTDLQRLKVSLLGSGLSVQTVAHVLSDVRCLFLWAVDQGHLDVSPVRRKLLPSVPELAPDRMTEAEAIVCSSVAEPHGFIVRLGLATGLRWGEMCLAQASHVAADELVVETPKTGRLRRVPLSASMADEIRGRVGRLVPYSVKSSGRVNERVRLLSGVAEFTVKKLRGTYACRWLEAGGTLAALQAILGHTTVRTTQRYGRLDADAIRREHADVFERIGKNAGKIAPPIPVEGAAGAC